MTYSGDRLIIGMGTATATQIDAWIASEGKKDGYVRYAPDKTYKAPPPLGQSIVGYSRLWGVNSDLVAAQLVHESAAWQSPIARDKRNPAGLGAENSDATGTAYDKAITFLTPDLGIRAQVAHLCDYAIGRGDWTQYDPRYAAMVAAGGLVGSAPTLKGLDGNWAVPGIGYGASIAALANDLVTFAQQTGGSVPTQRPPHIALSAGHRNTSGGDAHEIQQTAVLTPAIAAACRALGMDVRVVQGRDGADMFAGDLHAVAQTVAGWDAAGWPVDIYLETHTEGAGGARGMFAIYPDWTGDLDADVRDRLGPDIVARVTAVTDLGKRGSGLMSEKQTGVGADGDRLGIFAYTASIKDHATRLIVEFGAHDNAADLAIVDASDFAGKAGAAVAGAFAAFLGWQQTQPAPQPDQPAQPDAMIQPNNPYGAIPIVLGFRGYLEALAAARYPQDATAAILSIVGNAMGPEYPTQDGAAQEFERAVLKWIRGNSPPFDVVLALRSEGVPDHVAA